MSNEEANENLPKCPDCDSVATVDSSPRPQKAKENIHGRYFLRRRYYKCTGTPVHTFTTDEVLSYGRMMLVEKRDGIVVPFEFEKLLASIRAAGSPKKAGDRSYRKLAEAITDEAYERFKKSSQRLDNRRVVTSQTLGNLVLSHLQKEDRLAMWIRFSLIFHHLDNDQLTMKQIMETLRRKWSDPE